MRNLEPRIIKTDEQHRVFLAEVERLAVLDPDPESAQGLRLELLAKLVEDFEKVRFAFARPDPVDAILFRMEQQGLRQKDIAPFLGGKNRASEVLSRKRSLTLPMIRALYEELDIPPGLLIREPRAEYSTANSAGARVKVAQRTAVRRLSQPEYSGFDGFVSLRAVMSDLSQVPAESGVYIIFRRNRSLPKFQRQSPAGRFKGLDPSYPLDVLKNKWVPQAEVIYIGMAGPGTKRSLRKRIGELVHFGTGMPVAHRGGRALWQLHGIWDGQIAWKVIKRDPSEAERQLIAKFKAHFGQLPFANFRR
ncbi:MAG: helix-turn-helix domain-containing protein [Steroidobacteraceae bacterium]